MVFVYQYGRGGPGDPDTLTVYCAAGLQEPVDALAKAYRKEFGVDVKLQYAGTKTLLTQVRVAKRGDLFIAADQSAIDSARESGVADDNEIWHRL